MAVINLNLDTSLIIYRYDNENSLVGHFSRWKDTAYPATGNKITGWKWDERSWPGVDSTYTSTVPVLTNADLSGIPEEDFQSGIGSNNDLIVDIIEPEYIQSIKGTDWAPIVNHGYYYDFNEERYLYSDGVRTEYHLTSLLVPGETYPPIQFPPIPLDELPKIGIPIRAVSYKWNSIEQEYEIYQSLRQKKYFTGLIDSGQELPTYDFDRNTILVDNVDTSPLEFITETTSNGDVLIRFNKIYIVEHGAQVGPEEDPPTHHIPETNVVFDEVLGISNGGNNQQFHTLYSPIDNSMGVFIYTFTDYTVDFAAWTRVEEFSHDGMTPEYKVDTHLGIITFGSTLDNDIVPDSGLTIAVHYWSTLEIQYEPQFVNDTYTAIESSANVNPVRHTTNKGFIHIRTFQQKPTSVVLTTDLEELSLYNYGPLYIGNVFSKIIATVLDQHGDPIEDIDVEFFMKEMPPIGLFANGSDTVVTTTNDDGVAIAFYKPPVSIDDIGEYIDISGFATTLTETILTTSTIKVTGTQRNIYLYKVWTDDPVMGIPLGDQTVLDAGGVTPELEAFYEDFFIEEDINGPTGLPASTGAPWEHTHRLIQHLLTPAPFNHSFRNGRKQIVVTYDPAGLNPHRDDDGVFIPLQPTTVTTNIGGDSLHNDVRFDTILDPPTGDLDSYLLISPTNVVISASVTDEDGNVINSNDIQIQLEIPPSQNGTVYVDAFNDIPIDLLPYSLDGGDDGKTLPLGFRIRSTGITLASALNGVTYLDINKPAYMGHAFHIR